MPAALEVWSLNHSTAREVLRDPFFNKLRKIRFSSSVEEHCFYLKSTKWSGWLLFKGHKDKKKYAPGIKITFIGSWLPTTRLYITETQWERKMDSYLFFWYSFQAMAQARKWQADFLFFHTLVPHFHISPLFFFLFCLKEEEVCRIKCMAYMLNAGFPCKGGKFFAKKRNRNLKWK